MKVHGKTHGLKKSQIRGLERLYRRRVSGEEDVTPEMLRQMGELSRETHRRVGVLIDRQGRVKSVCVGDLTRLPLPEMVREARSGKERLCGLRLVHTRLRGDGFSKRDLTDLLRHRLDLSTLVQVGEDGFPACLYRAHLLPPNREEKVHEVLGPADPYEEEPFPFRGLVRALEEEFAATVERTEAAGEGERAILVAVTTGAPSWGAA